MPGQKLFRRGSRVQVSRTDPTVYTITDFFETDEDASIPEQRGYRTDGSSALAKRFTMLQEGSGLPAKGLGVYHNQSQWNRLYVSVRPCFETEKAARDAVPNLREHSTLARTSVDDEKVPFTHNTSLMPSDVYGPNSLHQVPFASLGVFVFRPGKTNRQTFYTFLKRVYGTILLVPTRGVASDVNPTSIQSLKRDALCSILSVNMHPRQTVLKTCLKAAVTPAPAPSSASSSSSVGKRGSPSTPMLADDKKKRTMSSRRGKDKDKDEDDDLGND
jgi:hypothetical protein